MKIIKSKLNIHFLGCGLFLTLISLVFISCSITTFRERANLKDEKSQQIGNLAKADKSKKKVRKRAIRNIDFNETIQAEDSQEIELKISDVRLDNPKLESGETIKIRWEIENNGNATAEEVELRFSIKNENEEVGGAVIIILSIADAAQLGDIWDSGVTAETDMNYSATVTVNPGQFLPEKNYENNTETINFKSE